jgi:hypothetical protein
VVTYLVEVISVKEWNRDAVVLPDTSGEKRIRAKSIYPLFSTFSSFNFTKFPQLNPVKFIGVPATFYSRIFYRPF